MDLFEAIEKRRSVRQFDKDKPVGDEIVKKILEAGVLAPSAGNGQCWRFYVVRDPKIKHRLALEAGHQLFIEHAPVAIVVCADLHLAEERYGERGRKTYALQDTSAAIENMLLAATALDLASCWIGAFDESIASEILGLPKHIRPVAMLSIGVPAEATHRMPKRRKIEEVAEFR